MPEGDMISSPTNPPASLAPRRVSPRAEYNKQYYQKNRERIAAKNKAFYENNRDKFKVYWDTARQRQKASGRETWQQRNREKQREAIRKWWLKNKDKHRENGKKWREANKEKIAAHKKQYRAKTREQRLIADRKYRAKNREKMNAYSAKYLKKLYATPRGAIDHRMSSNVLISLKRIGVKKRGRSWESLVGYTTEDLYRALEKAFQDGMNWGRFLQGDIHIDHVIPKAKFKYSSTDDIEFKRCWALENLQPKWALDNIRKGDSIEAPAQIPLGI